MRLKLGVFIIGIVAIAACACNNHTAKVEKPVIFRGLYTFGAEEKKFKDCDNGTEYWAIDSSMKLELAYSQMNSEMQYAPVYVEVEGRKVKSGREGKGSEFDSTMIVKKLIKITKEIPQDMCN